MNGSMKNILHQWVTPWGHIRLVDGPRPAGMGMELRNAERGEWEPCAPIESMFTKEILRLLREVRRLEALYDGERKMRERDRDEAKIGKGNAVRIPDSGRDVPGSGAEKTATQVNTAIPLVVGRENYADRLARWMEDERRREQRKAEYRWIPVTERLPDEETQCLVIGDGGQNIGSFAACAVWRRLFGVHSDPSWCFPHVDINVVWNLQDGVTHWMPLPSPPQ